MIVDHLKNFYVPDSCHYRIIHWSKESIDGSIVVNGNGYGEQPNQFKSLWGISFDRQDNIYIIDSYNSRVQKFNIN